MCTHSVHFYDDAYPADAASEFIAEGLRAGEACVVMLVKPHRQAVEARLNARGISTDAVAPGAYRAIDTDEALAELLVDGRLDPQRATESIGALLNPAGGSARVRLVGDPAAELYAAGNRHDAMALERLVDGLAEARSASVFCAYPIRVFCREGNTDSLLRFSAQHHRLAFPKQLWAQGYLESASVARASANG